MSPHLRPLLRTYWLPLLGYIACLGFVTWCSGIASVSFGQTLAMDRGRWKNSILQKSALGRILNNRVLVKFRIN